MDQTTYRRLGQRYQFGEARDVVVKGKGGMTIYQLLAVNTGFPQSHHVTTAKLLRR